MATGVSSVSGLASLYANIYEDAVFAVREGSLAPRIVTVFTNDVGDQTRQLPAYASTTFTEVAEEDDFALPTQFAKSGLATLTPGEVMAQIILTDRRIATDPNGARADSATELGLAAAEKVDTDIFSNFSSLTGGTVGASGSTMTWGWLLDVAPLPAIAA